MKTLYLFLTALICGAAGFNAFGQIAVTSGQTAQQLAEFLAGPNITVTNAVSDWSWKLFWSFYWNEHKYRI
jgi:hypothetical protein